MLRELSSIGTGCLFNFVAEAVVKQVVGAFGPRHITRHSQALLGHFCLVGEEVRAAVARSLSAGVRRCLWRADMLECSVGAVLEEVSPCEKFCFLLAPWRTGCLLPCASSCGDSSGLEHLLRTLFLFFLYFS